MDKESATVYNIQLKEYVPKQASDIPSVVALQLFLQSHYASV